VTPVVGLCEGCDVAGDEFRAILRGHDAVLGVVRARDVANLIIGLESAVAAAAYATLGTPRRATTGRHRAAIEAASRLRIEGVRAGSVVAVLSLPNLAAPDEDALDVGVDDLAGAAFDRIVASFQQPDDQVDQALARSLADLGERLGIGDRHDELVLTSPRLTAAARLDASARARMRRLADAPTQQQADILIGTLREADFDRRTARLRTATGETVYVDFSPDLDDAIQDALRGQAQFEGIVTFDAATTTTRRVELRRITTPDPLPFDTSSFWQRPTVAELAEAQGVRPALLDGPLAEWTEQDRAELTSALADLDA
jgi:hypothetical protein